jgi:hypothetical protein
MPDTTIMRLQIAPVRTPQGQKWMVARETANEVRYWSIADQAWLVFPNGSQLWNKSAAKHLLDTLEKQGKAQS